MTFSTKLFKLSWILRSIKFNMRKQDILKKGFLKDKPCDRKIFVPLMVLFCKWLLTNKKSLATAKIQHKHTIWSLHNNLRNILSNHETVLLHLCEFPIFVLAKEYPPIHTTVDLVRSQHKKLKVKLKPLDKQTANKLEYWVIKIFNI